MKTKFIAALLSTTGLIAASGAAAQSLPAPGQPDDGDWRHMAGIYMFAPLRTWGDSTLNGNTVPVDLSLKDILDVLDFAAAGSYEAWKGDFGIILDANYAGIEDKGTLSGGRPVSYRVNTRQKWLGLYGAYRVAQGTRDNGQPFAIDVQGGARWNSLRQILELGPIKAGGTEDWVEPVIGARGMWRMNDRWTAIASADLGGFGVGGNDLQIGVNAGFDYQPWSNTALYFGYRYFSIDYSSSLGGGFAYDTEQHGPYMGVKFFF